MGSETEEQTTAIRLASAVIQVRDAGGIPLAPGAVILAQAVIDMALALEEYAKNTRNGALARQVLAMHR